MFILFNIREIQLFCVSIFNTQPSSQSPSGLYRSLIMNLFKVISFLLVFSLTSNVIGIGQEKPEWLDPNSFAQNTLPASSRLIPYVSESKALTFDPTQSTLYKSLNGNWSFKWFKNPNIVPKNISDPSLPVQSWDQIAVPSYWQTVGLNENKNYDRPYYLKSGIQYNETASVISSDSNAVGIYRTTFNLPQNWKNQSVYLHFDGVRSACFVWINGYKVGYHEDSATPFSFQIDSLLKEGSNQLTVQVLKWSDGSYLENREGWQVSGIFRDVYLTFHKDVLLRDIFVNTKFDDNNKDATLNLRTTVKNNKNYLQYNLKVIATLYNHQDKIVGKPIEKVINILDSTSQTTFNQTIQVTNPLKWSAEIPTLYKLTIQLTDEKGGNYEVISQKVGFRELHFRSNQLRLNGKAITVKGVNLNTTGPVPPNRESMLRDITLMKQNNINAVWLNEGPHHPLWYDFCNEYGIYIVNQSNLYTLNRSNLPNTDDWKRIYLSRAIQMWERDKNNPSVIAWSVGGNGANLDDLFSYFQLADNSRPILYRGDESIAQKYDILTAGIITSSALANLPKDNTKPFLLHSFGQTDGNALGGIYSFWQDITKSTARQGGFLDNWSGNFLVMKNKTGENVEFRNYEPGSSPKGGLITSSGLPEPEIMEIKKAYEPIIILTADTIGINNKGTIITNKYDFKTLNDLELSWSVEENGKSIQNGVISLDGIRPNESKEIKFPFEWPPHPRPDGNYFLDLKVNSKTEKNHQVASKQIPLRIKKVGEIISVQQAPPLRMNFLRGIGIEISGANFSITFDKETAQMSSYVYKDKEFLETGFNGSFWRVPTSLDQIGGNESLADVWLKNGIDSLKTASSDLRVEKLNSHIYKVSMVKRLASKAGSIQINSIYTIYATGDIHVQYALIPSGSLPPLPRMGLEVMMRENMNQILWFGKGPYETYSDRKTAAFTSFFNQKISDQHYNYHPQQETGNKTEVQWFAVRDIENDGLIFIPDSLVCINIQNYSDRDLSHSQKTGTLLSRGSQVVLKMDLMQEGLGFNSQHLNQPKNIQPLTTHRFSFRIKPVNAQTDYFKEANSKLPIVARKMSPGLNKGTD